MNTVQELARRNRTVITVIHQPSSEVFVHWNAVWFHVLIQLDQENTDACMRTNSKAKRSMNSCIDS
jgi:hypothetical protein